MYFKSTVSSNYIPEQLRKNGLSITLFYVLKIMTKSIWSAKSSCFPTSQSRIIRSHQSEDN